jgi:hypothetical protein
MVKQSFVTVSGMKADRCRCGRELTGRQTAYCSNRCKQDAHRERKGRVTLAFTVEASTADELDKIAAAEGLTRSEALRQILLGHFKLRAAIRDAAASRIPHEPSADERATTNPRERTSPR